jgi:hypothetical protein
MICRLLKQTGQPLAALGNICEGIAGVVDGLIPLPSVAQTVQALQSGQLPPLPLPIAGQLYGGGQ